MGSLLRLPRVIQTSRSGSGICFPDPDHPETSSGRNHWCRITHVFPSFPPSLLRISSPPLSESMMTAGLDGEDREQGWWGRDGGWGGVGGWHWRGRGVERTEYTCIKKAPHSTMHALSVWYISLLASLSIGCISLFSNH